jgi:hypothetical protein
VGVSTATSQSGLDFDLPRAEIRGTITLAPTQFDARVDVSTDATCVVEGFRPQPHVSTSGPYAIVGIYAGTYCVSGDGNDDHGSLLVCYGDPTCASPTLITLTSTEVRTGVDLDFSAVSPIDPSSWGRIKTLYR